MWKYLKSFPPPKKRKADDKGVSDIKAKIRQFSKDENILIIVNYVVLNIESKL